MVVKYKAMKQIFLFGATALAVAWTGLQVWSAYSLGRAAATTAQADRDSLIHFGELFDRMPAWKLTFLGARLLAGGDYELAKEALARATAKDRWYRDAFRYYAYALQATGDNDKAELAQRRAKTLDPRVAE